MMHSSSAYEAVDAAHAFSRFGVDVPEDADRWIQRLTELRGNRPEPSPRNRVAVLIADNSEAADIDKAVADHVGNAHRVQQHAEAENIAGQRALCAIMAARDDLHRQLAKIADDIISRLHQAAAIDESIIDLTRSRRVEEAHILACADSDAAELHDLCTLRNRYLTPVGLRWSTGWWDCAHYRNPWDIGRGHENHGHADGTQCTPFCEVRTKVRQGAELWFPSIEEAHAESLPHEPTDNTMTPFDPKRTSAAFVG